MSTALPHIWQPIEGLPDPAALASPDVRAFTNLDIDPLLLSVEESEPAQLARLQTWLDRLTILATAQWIQLL